MWRRLTACIAALTLSAASIIDTSELYDEDVPLRGFASDVPAVPDSPSSGPADTLGECQAPFLFSPVLVPERTLVLACVEPVSADDPAPPTPPPIAVA